MAAPPTAVQALTAAIDALLERSDAQSVWVGFSAGLDSTTLLACAAHSPIARARGLKALHVHHGLHADADQWAEQAHATALALDVPLRVERVRVDARGQGLEAAARSARYAGFQAHLQPGGILLLAHHQQDQAETVLMRLLRGAALDGVAAMRSLRPLGSGQIGRPWLEQPRALIAQAARELDLTWVEDPSNADTRLDRAWLRGEIWPQLLDRFPEAQSRLTRFAAHARGIQQVIDRDAQVALDQVRAADPAALRIPALLALPEGLIGEVLRRHALACAAPPPGFHEIARIRREVIGARVDAEPCMRWHAFEYRRYRLELHLLEKSHTEAGPDEELLWAAGERVCMLPGTLGKLEALDAAGDLAALPERLRVRWRIGGERLRPLGSTHTRELRLIYQEQGVPPWVRDRLPMLYLDKELVNVPGIAASQRFAERFGKLHIRWRQLSVVSQNYL